METRVNSLETDLELLKKDMSACQASIRQDINHLRETRSELPSWLKNSAVGIILAIFAQTVSTVWWASELSAKQNNMQSQVEKNTAFIDSWPSMHNEVMVGLAEIKAESRHMKEMLRNLQKENNAIKAKQYGHFKDINDQFSE
jgi:D-mannonate dehydratase